MQAVLKDRCVIHTIFGQAAQSQDGDFFLAGRKAAAWGDVQAMLEDKSGDSFTVLVTVGVADASVVDHTPEELLNITATGALPP